MIYTVSANPALDLTLTVPAIEFEVVLRANEVRREWAGKGFNVSRFLKALGVDNVAMAFAAGYTGHALDDGLRAGGIETDFIYVDGETRTNVVIQEPESKRHIKVNQPGASVTPDRKAALLARAQQRVKPGDIWVLTGSLAPGLNPEFYAELATVLLAGHAQVILDTSGPALRHGCTARPQVVKPNAVEAAEFTGRAVTSLADAVVATQAFLAAGAQMVILSLGKEGAVVDDGRQQFHVRPPNVKVKTAVGAGDALVTGALWAMRQQLPAPDIARWGVTVGTVTAIHDDLAPTAWPELQAIYQQVQVTEL